MAAKGQGFQVRVTVRERPLVGGELAGAASQAWEGAFVGPASSQAEATEEVGIYELLDSFMEGIDCTVLAYGQTGSGKTHSMLGPPGALALPYTPGGRLPDSWGCWPRAMGAVLDRLQHGRGRLRLWAIEVYFDHVFDLLNDKAAVMLSRGRASSSGFHYAQNSQAQYDKNGKWIPPFQNGKENPLLQPGGAEAVVGQREVDVHSMEDVIRVGRTVEATRAAQSHSLNDRSSRSHAILGAVLTSGGRTSRWLFVDLAGSERVKKSEVSGLRMTEAVSTNKSLSALQRVIEALVRKDKFVPFRDHTLTQMLSQSLGVTSRTAVVVTVSAAERHQEETRNSLRFANLYLRVTARPVAPSPANAAGIATALAEAEQVVARLAESSHGGGINPDAPMCSRKAWEHNLEQLKMYRTQATAAKSELQNRDAADNEQAKFREKLAYAQAKVTLHEGVVARMMLSGLFKNPSPLLVKKQKEAARLRQLLQDVTGEAQEFEEMPGGEVVLGQGLAGMIRHLTASHVQGR